MKRIYIRAAEQISLQQPLSEAWMESPVRVDAPWAPAQDPDFRAWLSAGESRRLGRILKRALVSLLTIVRKTGVEHPDAICVGTGLGCMVNTERILETLCNEGESMVSPTHFMQSTHNTIASLLAIHTRSHGYNITYSHKDLSFDLALLDVMLPDIDGFELLRTIRSSHTYPVIMLTARDAQQDKIGGLSLGADDYVVKPFRPLELIARVHAQLRRYTSYGSRAQAAESPTIQLDGLEINRDARSVTVDGAPVCLTPTEYSILLYLVEHRGSVVAVEDLFRAVWNEDFMPGSNNTVMVHIRHLREKIGDDAQKPRFIKNVWGVGYIIE